MRSDWLRVALGTQGQRVAETIAMFLDLSGPSQFSQLVDKAKSKQKILLIWAPTWAQDSFNPPPCPRNPDRACPHLLSLGTEGVIGDAAHFPVLHPRKLGSLWGPGEWGAVGNQRWERSLFLLGLSTVAQGSLVCVNNPAGSLSTHRFLIFSICSHNSLGRWAAPLCPLLRRHQGLDE